jgi:hypothetical protein
MHFWSYYKIKKIVDILLSHRNLSLKYYTVNMLTRNVLWKLLDKKNCCNLYCGEVSLKMKPRPGIFWNLFWFCYTV